MILASIVIPTRNRAALLRKCLESLTRQTLPTDRFEVIIVDNGSTDDTASVASAFAASLNMKVVFAAEPGLHVGRHEGLRSAKADILMYADDDILALPTWVESVVSVFSDPSVALVGGNNYPLFEGPIPDWLELLWSRPVYKGRALGYLSVLDFGTGRFPLDPAFVWGCNFSIRKQALLAAGGFHPDSLPRDMLQFRGDGESHVASVIRERGFTTIFDSGASVYHTVSAARMTADYFRSRAYAQGISDSYTAVRSSGRTSLLCLQVLRAHQRAALIRVRDSLRCPPPRKATKRALLEVQRSTVNAWRDGYIFHQKALRTDPGLIDWVLKESYIT